MELSVLHYRPWQGTLRRAWASPWVIARIALRMVFTKKLFWILYILALINFMIFFSGIYLLAQADLDDLAAKATERTPTFLRGPAAEAFNRGIKALREQLNLAGTPATFRNFIWYQGYIVMAVLALAGSILVGNDYQHGTLSFYLSKPLGRRHYLLGKFLAVALFINMTTTLPALGLYLESGLLDETGWQYFEDNLQSFYGILGYGALLTVCMGLLVLATATGLRKTLPLVATWAGLLYFCRVFSVVLVDRLGFNNRWRLLDIWNSLYVLGSWCLGTEAKLSRWQKGGQPPTLEVALVVLTVCILCLIYLSRRIRAVEIVR